VLLKWWKARKQRILEEEAERERILNERVNSKQRELDSRLNIEQEKMYANHCPFENRTCNHNRNCVHFYNGYAHAYSIEDYVTYNYKSPCCRLWESN